MQILKRLSNFFLHDELVGKWHTDDGTGFMIIMGSWIHFKKNGTGNYHSWSTAEDDTGYDFEGSFTWKRTAANRIILVENGEQEEIIYTIDNELGRKKLSSVQQKMGTVTLEGFWNFAQVMFK